MPNVILDENDHLPQCKHCVICGDEASAVSDLALLSFDRSSWITRMLRPVMDNRVGFVLIWHFLGAIVVTAAVATYVLTARFVIRAMELPSNAHFFLLILFIYSAPRMLTYLSRLLKGPRALKHPVPLCSKHEAFAQPFHPQIATISFASLRKSPVLATYVVSMLAGLGILISSLFAPKDEVINRVQTAILVWFITIPLPAIWGSYRGSRVLMACIQDSEHRTLELLGCSQSFADEVRDRRPAESK